MIPQNGKILWLKGGTKGVGFYEPTLTGDGSQLFDLRNTRLSWFNDIRLGEISDNNQIDLDSSNKDSVFIEYLNDGKEYRYIKYNIDRFDKEFDVKNVESSVSEQSMSIFRKFRWQILSGLLLTMVLILVGKLVPKTKPPFLKLNKKPILTGKFIN